MAAHLSTHDQLGMTDSERLDWLRLYRSENVGPHSFYRLLATYGTAARALDALPDLAQRGGYGRALKVATKAEAERELSGIAKLGARLLCAGEPGFPSLLAEPEALNDEKRLESYVVEGIGCESPSHGGRAPSKPGMWVWSTPRRLSDATACRRLHPRRPRPVARGRVGQD